MCICRVCFPSPPPSPWYTELSGSTFLCILSSWLLHPVSFLSSWPHGKVVVLQLTMFTLQQHTHPHAFPLRWYAVCNALFGFVSDVVLFFCHCIAFGYSDPLYFESAH